MARNDVVLLDALTEKSRARLAIAKDDSELFELFVFEQVLKDFDLDYDELETGWTDGGDDGGVDGFYVFIDGRAANDDIVEHASRKNPTIELHLFSVRRSAKFELQPIDALHASLEELLDLTLDEADLKYPYNARVLDMREFFQRVVRTLADRQPTISITIHYCSRGDATSLPPNLAARAKAVEALLASLFSQTAISFSFKGASELLSIARRQLSYTLRLSFAEPPISRDGRDFVTLATLGAYYRFICDEDGALRRYLFESNVRDYLGEVQINNDIARTLRSARTSDAEDFWWLNNGVTILTSKAQILGKELLVENVQIVNGLQTTETLFRHFQGGTDPNADNRAILIKVIQVNDESTRTRIVKATNYQNTVDLASLRGLDKIQVDIDDFLVKHGWYYDRRRNVYKNQGKPANRIVTLPYLGAAVRAVALGDPARSQRQRSRSLRDDDTYMQVFNSSWDLEVYLASLEITKAVESSIYGRNTVLDSLPIALVNYIACLHTCVALGKARYEPNEVAALAGHPPTPEQVEDLKKELAAATTANAAPGRKFLGISLNRQLFEKVLLSKFASAPKILRD